MSYLDSLSNIRDSLTSQQEELQSKFNDVVGSTTQILEDKVSQISDKMEMIGGLGFGAMELAGKGKQIFEKVDGLINNKAKPPTTEPTQEGMEFTTRSSQSTPIENEGGEEMTATVEDGLPADELMPAGAGGPVALGETTMANGVLQGGEVPVEASMTTPAIEGGEIAADSSATFGDMSASAAATALSGATEGTALAGAAVGAGEGVAVAGMAIADSVLAAVPVVGEIALIGTAIVGGLMSLFGIHHDPAVYNLPAAPTELISNVGTSISQLVPKQVIGGIV
jgi:hypothetical protein